MSPTFLRVTKVLFGALLLSCPFRVASGDDPLVREMEALYKARRYQAILSREVESSDSESLLLIRVKSALLLNRFKYAQSLMDDGAKRFPNNEEIPKLRILGLAYSDLVEPEPDLAEPDADLAERDAEFADTDLSEAESLLDRFEGDPRIEEFNLDLRTVVREQRFLRAAETELASPNSSFRDLTLYQLWKAIRNSDVDSAETLCREILDSNPSFERKLEIPKSINREFAETQYKKIVKLTPALSSYVDRDRELRDLIVGRLDGFGIQIECVTSRDHDFFRSLETERAFSYSVDESPPTMCLLGEVDGIRPSEAKTYRGFLFEMMNLDRCEETKKLGTHEK